VLVYVVLIYVCGIERLRVLFFSSRKNYRASERGNSISQVVGMNCCCLDDRHTEYLFS
jgi:hypothetical protein